MFIQDALFGTTITKYTPPLKIQYARKIMYIYQFAFFRQAQTEITKAATNFKKSAGKFAYAQPLYNNHVSTTVHCTPLFLSSWHMTLQEVIKS